MIWFWDTSAIGALIIDEPASHFFRRISENSGKATVWALTSTELASVIERRKREGFLEGARLEHARRWAAARRSSWRVIDDFDHVQGHAVELLSRHPLKAADALQLGAALVGVEGRPSRHFFVAGDGPLRRAAEAEGFRVVGPP